MHRQGSEEVEIHGAKKNHYLKFELRIFFVEKQYVVCFCNKNMCNGPEHNKTEAQLKRGKQTDFPYYILKKVFSKKNSPRRVQEGAGVRLRAGGQWHRLHLRRR